MFYQFQDVTREVPFSAYRPGVFTAGYVTRDELSAIVDILLGDVRARLAEKEMKLALSPAVKAMLVEKGTDFKFGARPLKRAIRKMIEDPLSEKLLAREFRAGDTRNAKKVGDALEFARKLPAKRKRTGAHVPTAK